MSFKNIYISFKLSNSSEKTNICCVYKSELKVLEFSSLFRTDYDLLTVKLIVWGGLGSVQRKPKVLLRGILYKTRWAQFTLIIVLDVGKDFADWGLNIFTVKKVLFFLTFILNSCLSPSNLYFFSEITCFSCIHYCSPTVCRWADVSLQWLRPSWVFCADSAVCLYWAHTCISDFHIKISEELLEWTFFQDDLFYF